MDAKKSMRHFYCRDAYWEIFETMASDFAVSVDYLINEAMRHYAKNKGYEFGESAGSQIPTGSTNPPTVEFAINQNNVMPPIPVAGRRATSSGAFSLGAELFSESKPDSAPLTLYIIHEDEKLPIDKDQFIIGRVSKLCDLTVKDANISRKHAAVIKRNGQYYIKDLGSTNGIEYNGMRIDNKRIDEGDIFSLCENQVRFTFK
ncbi:FHA domain-containing protein [Myxococcota bacterium]|nr:FHA domain-containing protein [Myxococcota bacterium]